MKSVSESRKAHFFADDPPPARAPGRSVGIPNYLGISNRVLQARGRMMDATIAQYAKAQKKGSGE